MKSFHLVRRGPDQLGLGVSGRRYWWRMGRKIAIMGANAALLRSLISLPLSLAMMPGAGMMAAILFISIPLGWLMSFLWGGLLSLILLPCVYLGQRLIAEPIRRDTTGWISGSAVSVVGSAGGLFHIGSIQASANAMSAGIAWMLAIQVAGGFLAIAADQAGGYLGSMSALRRRGRCPDGDRTSRFTVWRLMAITAILSVLLSLLTLTGDFIVPLILAIVVSSGIAWAIHRPVAWATNLWLDWLLRRRRRKRAKARVTPSASRAG
ncbi:hypothetical protein Pla108_34590 [Botrimarina colliarenosi]|uniref:Uncharacterized protein n=1 Tax=Botrimarina colliarenosi TaxID=2528001 RepID=A0A5C6A5T9_9BACT|nr:hypothetical protein [Botrimarina colliarenosi]TWT95314.1 hypothetical protein Pla108_34590 [Botrimarina colliarenosi]